MRKYKITQAHSGTSEKEIAKAKKYFLAQVKNNNIFASEHKEPINIRFSDVNNNISAEFYNISGQPMCVPAVILSAN